MSNIRPGSRVPFWSPKFKYKPGVEPPLLLRLLSALSIVSVVGVLVYAVALALEGPWSTTRGVEEAPYIAVLHFALPVCIFYTVGTNSWISRPLIAVYFAALYGATMWGKGLVASLDIDPDIIVIVATGALILILAWLFRSPAMRIYYLLLAERPIPEELMPRARQLAERQSPNPKFVAAMEWFVDHLETLVMLGFIAAVIFAWVQMDI